MIVTIARLTRGVALLADLLVAVGVEAVRTHLQTLAVVEVVANLAGLAVRRQGVGAHRAALTAFLTGGHRLVLEVVNGADVEAGSAQQIEERLAGGALVG